MSLHVIRSTEELIQLRDSWGDLYKKSSSATVFQSYEYNLSAWNFIKIHDKAENLYIVIDKDQSGALNLILPCYIDERGYLRFINDLHTDFCDCLISDNSTSIHHLMEDLFELIQKESEITFLYFDNLRGGSPLTPYFKVFGNNTMIFSQTEHTSLHLQKEKSYPESFSHLKSKERAKLKKILRDAPPMNLKHFKSSEQVFPEEVLQQLWKEITDRGLRSRSYLNPDFFNFTRDMYQNGLLEIILLHDPETDNPAAAAYFYVSSEQNFWMQWVILCADKRLNLPLDILCCNEFSKVNEGILDFGRGGYFYKVHNFKPEIKPLYRLLLSKNLRGNLYILYRVMIAHLRKTYNKYHE